MSVFAAAVWSTNRCHPAAGDGPKDHETRDEMKDQSMKEYNGHRIKNAAHCRCNRVVERCPTCNWGLSVCYDCGRAEAELAEPCDDAGRLRHLSRLVADLDHAFNMTDREWGELPRLNLDTFNQWCEILRIAERAIEETRASQTA
jgi:hypothetical protein